MNIKNILNLLFNKNNFYLINLKKIYLIILFCFYINLLQNYSYAFQANTKNSDFLIFSSFGKVVDRYEGTSSKKIIIIQDLHCQPDVQENIKNILEEIKRQYGENFNLVGIEGTPVSDINIDNFLKIKNQKIKVNIANYFAKKGIISGAELYLIMNPKSVVLRGIEDKYLYLRNFYSFCKSFKYLNDLDLIFNNLINGYNRTRKYFYFDGVSDLDDKKKRYENKEIELEKYLEYLKVKSLEFGINFEKDYESLSHVLYMSRYRKNLDIIGIEKEIFLLLDQLSKNIDKREIDQLNRFRNSGVKYYYVLLDILNKKNLDISRNYKKLNDYFRYLDFIRNINDKKIILEQSDLEFKLRSKILSEKGDSFTFFKSEHDLNILRKYLKNELSSKEIEEYESEKNRLIKIKYFSNKLFRKDYFIGREKELIEAESNMKSFYIDAEKRNEVLTNNLLNYSLNRSKVSAIVVGGYHSEGIKNYLKSKGISYEEVIPKGRDFRGKNYYKERLFEQEKWLNKLNKENFSNLYIECKKNYGNNFKENINSLQLISVFADRGLFLDEKNIEDFLLIGKVLSLDETKSVIKDNIGNELTSLEFFELVINVARNYDQIKGDLKSSDLGRRIAEILEKGDTIEKTNEILEVLNIYDKARKNIERNLNLSAKDKMIAEEALKLEEKAEMKLFRYSRFDNGAKYDDVFYQTLYNIFNVTVHLLSPVKSIQKLVTKLSGSLDSCDVANSTISNIEWKYKNYTREVYILADDNYIDKHPYDILSKQGKIYFTPKMAVIWDQLSPLIKSAIMKHEELEIILSNHFEAIEADKETGWIINRFNKYILEKGNENKIKEFNDLIEEMFNTSRDFLINFSHLGGIKDISILEGGRGLAKPQQIIPIPVKYVWKLVGKVSEGKDRDKADFILKFNQFLGKQGIPVSKFLPNEYGEFLIENKSGEYYALSQFVSDGKVISGKDYTDEQNKNRGILVAQMQNVLVNFDYPNREKIKADWLNPNNLVQILSIIQSNKDTNPLISSINIEEQADLYRRDFENLSRYWNFGYIHGDMNPGNIVFDGDRITGLIDFACACYYYRIGEFLRIAIGGSDRSMDQAGYDKEKLKLAIIGYQSEAIEGTRLSEEEIRGIIAILRFEFIKISRNPEARQSFVNKFFPIYLEDFGTEEKIIQFIDDISRSIFSRDLTLRVQNFSEITTQSKDSFFSPVPNSSTSISRFTLENVSSLTVNPQQQITEKKVVVKLRGFAKRRSELELFGEEIKIVTVYVMENLGVKFQDLTERMNEAFTRLLKKKVAKEIEQRIYIRDWELEIVERVNYGIMSMDMETQYERVKRNAKIRISKTLLECLSKLKKIIDQKEYNILLQEIFLHERLEILYRNSYPNKTAQECHDFALNNAGERQKSFLESLKILEEFDQVKIETKLSREELGIIQGKIDFLKGRLKISDQSIYKMYPNVEKCIINNTTTEKYKNRVLVIDINNKEISQILHELNILKIENKVGLNIVLVGEPKDRQRINDLLDYIKSKSNILMEIEWVIGKETCIAIEKGRIEGLGSLLERGQIKIVRNMGNGYMLTVSGVVTESLYEKMLIIYNRKSMSSREISMILNNEFYQGKYDGEILREYFRSDINESSKRVNQLILGIGIDLQGEAKNMAENIINREIKKEGEIKILEKTEEGIEMSKEVDVAVVIEKKDMLESTEKEVNKIKVIGRENIELAGISERDQLFKNITLYINREIIKVAVKTKIFKFMQIKKDKAIDLNFDTVKSMSAAA